MNMGPPGEFGTRTVRGEVLAGGGEGDAVLQSSLADGSEASALRGGSHAREKQRRENRAATTADHPDVSRVLARFRRSTRMPMKERSNLLRQSADALSRSATPMRTMRESLAAVTEAPRSWLESER